MQIIEAEEQEVQDRGVWADREPRALQVTVFVRTAAIVKLMNGVSPA